MTTQRNYTGYSGQMAVMSELIFRKCNVAISVLDVGMDVFAFRDDREEVARIQVKAAQGTPYQKGGGYRAQFNFPMTQFKANDRPPLFYVFVVRLEEKWVSFLVISRGRLQELQEVNRRFGIENTSSDEIALQLKFRPQVEDPEKWTVRCGAVELDDYLDAWEQLPPLRSLREAKVADEPLPS